MIFYDSLAYSCIGHALRSRKLSASIRTASTTEKCVDFRLTRLAVLVTGDESAMAWRSSSVPWSLKLNLAYAHQLQPLAASDWVLGHLK